MGAPKNNKFWELRSSHGRKKIFENPLLLWDAAKEYFEWCIENPFEKAELTTYQGESKIEKVPVMRPFTLEGLCLYCDVNTAYFRQFKEALRQKNDDEAKDFSTVIAQIEETINNQQFSGAASGFLNANIIARKLGLKEQTDNTQTVVIPDLTPEQRKKFKDEFDSKY